MGALGGISDHSGLNEDGTHHQTKYLRREDYLPVGSIVHMEGREFRVDKDVWHAQYMTAFNRNFGGSSGGGGGGGNYNNGDGGDGSGCGCLIAIAVVVVLILIVMGG